ncbi:type II toxin-antitoxin system PemK/MazF family toxin [Luteipulveratus halotolerans]|uniref:mRNA interferase n=1 Tax=Luteipulveratus halotolerans TaxID=1631356 RepID=A0A0L6CGR4_9MICO|nr:type II toxin-antitoxin system PemK/MazF family toxin [Luteipulveratus halotolerans]KNX36987.1 growth inhibitor PemK [Luteipulveratus halotolerans]
MPDLACGEVVWVNLSPVIGSEQSGHRPAVIVSGPEYLAVVPNVVIVVPVTTRDRGLPNHVRLTGSTGLEERSFAMTEQPRTVDRRRITRSSGQVDRSTLHEMRSWLRDFLDLGRHE